jgi:16S rRNA (cytosine967-C5)-methyltransferase
MSISAARRIAFDILVRVESEGAYASDLLHAELANETAGGRSVAIKPEDAALATEITLGVLRWRRLLDSLLALQLKKPPDRLDTAVAVALRMGLYQLRFLQRIPARAAVNESVELVKRARKSSAASLVNAVLRRCAGKPAAPLGGRSLPAAAGLPVGRHGFSSDKTEAPGAEASAHEVQVVPSDLAPPLSAATSPADRLAIAQSHPTWLVERWLACFGEQRTLALLDANNRPPRLALAVHDPARREEIAAGLQKSGLRVEPGALLDDAFVVSGGSIVERRAFRDGLVSVQDEASQAVPLLLDVHQGDRVLDLCAAPGGKTAPLARAAGNRGFIIAADRHAHRLRAMRAQFERLHLDRVNIVELDAEKPLPFAQTFDRILVDAPCSGTGTLARHPEIRWRLRPEQLADFRRLQLAILCSAMEALAPGGRLVYSTCSLEPEENESVVAEALARSGVRQVSITVASAAPALAGSEIRQVPTSLASAGLAPHLAPGVESASLFDAHAFFRTFPGEHPTDGFFAVVLER